MYQLPEPPAATATGQATPTDADRAAAARLLAALDEIPTSYRDHTPVPAYGTAPPVPQPGRPPMSQQATDASSLMIAGGFTALMVGGGAGAAMYFSQFANPVALAILFGAPTALALAIARVLKSAKQAVPGPTINNYSGPVHQQHTHTETRGVWARTDNRQ